MPNHSLQQTHYDWFRQPTNVGPACMAGNYAAGGGCLSTRGKAASIQAQRGALEVQIVIAGLARFGSSKVPARTKIKCGLASASLKSGVPHSGQNRRCIRLPLSATLEKSLVFPTTLNVAVRKQAPTVPLPAPKYWQSRHQHTRVVIGGSALSQRTAPQRHLPVTVIWVLRGQERRLTSPRIVRLPARSNNLTLRRTRSATAGFARFRDPERSNALTNRPSVSSARNPSLNRTIYSTLRLLPQAGELKR